MGEMPPLAGEFSVPQLVSCAKDPGGGLDKACSPGETVHMVMTRFQAMADKGLPLLSELLRVDAGRLNIPVYQSLAGEEARRVLPDGKQIGGGVDQHQAKASALMKLVENYSFHAFWKNLPIIFHDIELININKGRGKKIISARTQL